MARRVVVPATDDPEGLEEPQVIEVPQAGDLEHLANAEQEWRWVVYRKLRPEERSTFAGALRVILGKLEGAVDIEQVRRDWGGGTFEFWGSIAGEPNARLRVKHEISLAGPIKSLTGPEPPTPVQAVTQNGNGNSAELVKILERIESRLAAPPPAPVAPQGLTLKDVLGLIPILRGDPPPPPPNAQAQVSDLLGILKTGIELGTQREPGEPQDMGTLILEKALPAIERVATAIATRRPAPRPGVAGPRPNPTDSSAEVVGEPVIPGAVVSHDEQESEARILTLVSSMARAVTQETDPIDFADTVERILNPEELFWLKSSTPEKLQEEIRTRIGERYPVLATPNAREYLEALLSELRNPTLETESDPA
jgi:hypothetical protein